MAEKPSSNEQPDTPAQPNQQPAAPETPTQQPAAPETTEAPTTTSTGEIIDYEKAANIKLSKTSDTKSEDIYYNLIHLPYDLQEWSAFKQYLGRWATLTYGNINQIVDILNNYRWTMESINGGNLATNTDSMQFDKKYSSYNSYKTYDIPFCYATEWRQNIGSSIMNLINSLSSAVTGVQRGITVLKDNADNIDKFIGGVVKGLGSIFTDQEITSESNTVQNLLGGAVNGISGLYNKILTKDATKNTTQSIIGALDDTMGAINNPAKGSTFLKPYSLLYSMNMTGKRYAFPMVLEPPKFIMGSNSFSDGNEQGSRIYKSLDSLMNIALNLPALTRDVQEIGNLLGGKGGSVYDSISVEKAKYFNFPTNTNSYTVTFPLINTIGKDEWKKNYTFILLFILRNMIFRKDNSSYYPPLIYDIIIPGTIRQPFCYVQNVNVQPHGVIRSLPWDAKMFGALTGDKSSYDTKMTVFVPQAWTITITFTSLLAPSANMLLSSLTDLSISTKPQ